MSLNYNNNLYINELFRDIAARNVLVSTRDCVKLSDFGLSRLAIKIAFKLITSLEKKTCDLLQFRRFALFIVCMLIYTYV